MLKQLLHFDTVDGIQSYDSILKIYHCYNTKLNINKPLTNIKEISLKSLEMPLFFNNKLKLIHLKTLQSLVL
jgi:hypothetical protein